MHQVIQYQKTGELRVAELPAPVLKNNGILVRNAFSLISAGTEKTSVATAQASYLGKAKSRPDLVKQVIENAKREGLWATYEKVQNRLDNYKELGYSSAGIVLESSTAKFQRGDRVACAGTGVAAHAEIISVPANLAVKIPENVGFDEAAFTTVGAIALQGVRQADARIGESVVVIGLGLIGLLTVQLLRSAGCRVFGMDISRANFALARENGCEVCAISHREAINQVQSFTRGYGADAILLTAATRSNEPLELALEVARKKAKVIVVGTIGTNVPRSPFYEKEIDLRIACSYGPGRYDPEYEEKGRDYPVGYVRWTENRNMEAVLDLMSQRQVNVKPLVSHTFPIENALGAYDLITGRKQEKHLGVLLSYPNHGAEAAQPRRKVVAASHSLATNASKRVVIGFIGAGNFAQSYLLPALKRNDVALKGVVTSKPVNARAVAEKFHFGFCTTDAQEVFSDAQINTVFIASRHDTHARYVLEALKSGKHVFVEKPLALNEKELDEVAQAAGLENSIRIMTGFNRRFSRPFKDIKSFFAQRCEPLVMSYRVNAGYLPPTHWTLDPAQGGRIIGEACHFLDCFAFLAAAEPVQVSAVAINSSNTQIENNDNLSVNVKYADGSIASLSYFACGDRGLGKEYCEVHCGGNSAALDNYQTVSFYARGRRHKKKYNGAKGHREEVEHFLQAVLNNHEPEMTFEEIYFTTLTTFKIHESLRTGKTIDIQR